MPYYTKSETKTWSCDANCENNSVRSGTGE